MDWNCIKKTYRLETKTHSDEFRHYKRWSFCFVSGGEIIGELAEGAFRISLEGGMMMKSSGKNGAEKKRN